MRLTTTVKKGLAVIAVAAVSFIGVSSMANAVDPTGTLTIHKYTKEADNGTTPGTGATSDENHKGSGKPVEGVVFTIKKVVQTGDLSTNAQLKIASEIETAFKTQKDINQLTYGTDRTKVTFENSPQTATTSSEGEATLSSLGRGLYYVYESDVSGAKVNSQKRQVNPTEPFFVTLPMDGKMTVHVYPKNQVSEDTTKVPDFSDLKNNKVTYTVTAFLPKKPEGGFAKFDLLDKPGTAFSTSSFKLKNVKAIDKNTPTPVKREWSLGEGLTPNGTDDNPSIKVTEDNGIINCSFKDSQGLQELGTAADDGANQVIYTYTIDLSSEFVRTGGVVENKALVVPSPQSSTDIDGGTGGDTPPGIVTDTKKLVNLKIEKQDGSSKAKLANASFDIYSCETAGKTGDDTTTNYKNLKGESVVRTAAQKWNKDSLTSASGTGLTSGVLIPENTKVCIKETNAPDSDDDTPYMQLPEDILVTTNTLTPDLDNTQQTVTVDNYKRNFNFSLPMTGANAVIVLTLSGLALIIAAAVLRMHRAKN